MGSSENPKVADHQPRSRVTTAARRRIPSLVTTTLCVHAFSWRPAPVIANLTRDYQRKESGVEIVGWIAIVIVALIVPAVLAMILGSISDITRYLRIRGM